MANNSNKLEPEHLMGYVAPWLKVGETIEHCALGRAGMPLRGGVTRTLFSMVLTFLCASMVLALVFVIMTNSFGVNLFHPGFGSDAVSLIVFIAAFEFFNRRISRALGVAGGQYILALTNTRFLALLVDYRQRLVGSPPPGQIGTLLSYELNRLPKIEVVVGGSNTKVRILDSAKGISFQILNSMDTALPGNYEEASEILRVAKDS
jgi:hypothetical protein